MKKSKKIVAPVPEIMEEVQDIQLETEKEEVDEVSVKAPSVKKIFFSGRYWNLEKLTADELEFLRTFPEDQLGVKL